MLDLYEELGAIVDALESRGIEYALCGGIAMAVFGFPRATVDIDLLIQPDDLARAESLAESHGYTFRANPMRFSSGAIVIHRISRIDPVTGDVLMLDWMLVTPAIADVWSARMRLEWERGPIWVVSREGLIKLKLFRSSGTDMDDIQRLRENA